jgi:hypothetical protein
MTSHDGRSRKAARKLNQPKEQKMKSLKFFKPALATTLAIVVGWLLSVRPAEAGYTVTLQQVGPDVVATGSGAINLTGLTFEYSAGANSEMRPSPATILTGPTTSSSVDLYTEPRGPTSFGTSGFFTLASSGSGDMVGIATGEELHPVFLTVPSSYVSGTFLSNSATWSGKTFATLGVTPGTYVWTWGTGANQNFTLHIPPAPPTPGPPVVSTSPAALIGTFSARLNGSLDPHGLTTTVHFQYGTTTSYGSATSMQTQTGNTYRNITANITGLLASTTYHFRIVATNSAGTRMSGDRTFTTLSPTGPPVVTTSPARLIASFSATLDALLDPHGLTTSVHFQYGPTTGYGLTTAPQSQSGNTYRNDSATISSLTASTTYHFRVVASNSAGTLHGTDRTFTTLSATGAPVVSTSPATNLTTSSATLNGSLDPHGLTTTVSFQWGMTTSYGHTIAMQSQAGNTYRNITANISGLTTHTTYHFRIVATNSGGTRYGSDRILTTP